MYERQTSIPLKKVRTASIVGCGGTGFWTALLLGMSGVSNLIVIDDGIVEESNLNRLPLHKRELGSIKVDSLSRILHNIRPDILIETHCTRLMTSEDCNILDGVVFCCTDSVKSQQMINAYCVKNNIQYQRVGYDGTFLNVSSAYPLSFNKELPEGYTVTPSWVIPAVVAAGLGISSRLLSEIVVTEDISTITHANSSYISPKLKRNIILEECDRCDRGNCDDCSRGDCDNCDRGYCTDCDRGDCNDCDRGDCNDCEFSGVDTSQIGDQIVSLFEDIVKMADDNLCNSNDYFQCDRCDSNCYRIDINLTDIEYIPDRYKRKIVNWYSDMAELIKSKDKELFILRKKIEELRERNIVEKEIIHG